MATQHRHICSRCKSLQPISAHGMCKKCYNHWNRVSQLWFRFQIKRKEKSRTKLTWDCVCWLVGWMEQKERKPKGYKFKCRCGSRRPYGRRMMCYLCYGKFLRVSDCLADWIFDLSTHLFDLIWLDWKQNEKVVAGRMCLCGSLHVICHGLCESCYKKVRRVSDWIGLDWTNNNEQLTWEFELKWNETEPISGRSGLLGMQPTSHSFQRNVWALLSERFEGNFWQLNFTHQTDLQLGFPSPDPPNHQSIIHWFGLIWRWMVLSCLIVCLLRISKPTHLFNLTLFHFW